MINKIKSPDELLKLQERIIASRDPNRLCVTICAGTGCLALGAKKIIAAFREELSKQGLEDKVQVRETGCPGFCEKGPIVVLAPEGITYLKVGLDDVPEIVSRTIVNDELIERLVYTDSNSNEKFVKESDIPFYRKQKRLLLGNNSNIDPRSIEDYLAINGYSALSKAMLQASPENIVGEVIKSGLRGRGGGGFPTGLKWDSTRKVNDSPKYVVCNADEGDPGAFMDRALLEGNPHAVLEGMTIGAYAIGATHGYIYVRNEYPLAVENVTLAVKKAQELGLLGKNIMGSGFDFEVKIVRGGGSFVCGEETALLRSLEGDPGEPRAKPPYPSVKGLWGKPTNINNVETWANVPLIIDKGADWYAGIGTENSKGTKIFSLVGKINNTGLVEVPMGITLREIVFEIGGGIPNGGKFKAVQTGGPSGGCIPEQFLDMPIDFDELAKIGSIMGSGGMIVMDDSNCMVDVAKYFLGFLEGESCGKCTPCREGIRQMHLILKRITEGEGREEDIETLEWMGQAMRDFSLCGLGKTAANSVLSTIRYFREEYERHIRDKRCDALVCKKLTGPRCQAACPVDTEPWRYVALIEKGDYEGAYQVIRSANPFPAVCGRVCDRKCESRCSLGAGGGEALAIRALKRFVTDRVDPSVYNPPMAAKKKEQVAVVGAGPAGLTAAHCLSLQGYSVALYEEGNMPGGMLSFSLPSYRLPREIVEKEIKSLLNQNISIKYGQALGKDMTIEDLLTKEFKAVFLSTGAHESLRLGLENEDAGGVFPSIQFLKAHNVKGEELARGHVGIIGGGNAAVDAARVARRQKQVTEVTLFYRRTRHEMPAYEEEIEAALEEGVRIETLVSPVRIYAREGHVAGIECIRNRLGEVDASGRRMPIPVPGGEFKVDLDTLIVAVGEKPTGASFAAMGLQIDEAGRAKINNKTFETSLKGVFAGGDVVTGPNTVIDAISSGKKAAESIDRFLRNQELAEAAKPKLPSFFIEPAAIDQVEVEGLIRVEPPSLALGERVKNFREVTMVLPENMAQSECRRCLRCDLEFTREKLIDQPPTDAIQGHANSAQSK